MLAIREINIQNCSLTVQSYKISSAFDLPMQSTINIIVTRISYITIV